MTMLRVRFDAAHDEMLDYLCGQHLTRSNLVRDLVRREHEIRKRSEREEAVREDKAQIVASRRAKLTAPPRTWTVHWGAKDTRGAGWQSRGGYANYSAAQAFAHSIYSDSLSMFILIDGAPLPALVVRHFNCAECSAPTKGPGSPCAECGSSHYRMRRPDDPTE